MVLSNYINLLLDLDANQIQYRLLKPIFNIIAWVYDMLMDIIEKTAFDDIKSFTKSIYALVGVIMLFRLAISCLNYLINPETLSDKTTGGGKMAGRIVVSLILILASSFVFDLLKEFQIDMINPSDGAIFRIININGNQEVIPMTRLNRKAKYPCAVTSGSQFANDAFMAFVEGDVEGYSTVSQVTFARSRCSANAEWGDTYNAAKKEMDSGFASDNITVQFLAGLVLGLAIIVFFIILCIDVIVRDLKLLVLEMIAPSAFIAYINPNDKIFKQWLKTYGSVYLDLFIKLFAVSLLLKLLQFIGSANLHGFELIFYILALLVFAKALPGFISKLFGIDGAGSIKESAGMLKKALGAGAGLVGAAAVGGISKGVAAYQGVRGRGANNGKGRALAHALGSGLLGAGKGGLMGAGAGWSGKGISSVNAKSIKSAKNLGNNLTSGGTFFGRTGSKIRSTFGVATKGEKETAQIEASGNVVKQQSAMNSTANSEVAKDQQTITEMNSGDLGKTSLQKAKLKVRDLEQLRKSGAKAVSIAANRDLLSDMDINEVQQRLANGETLVGQDGKKIEQSAIAAALGKGMKSMKVSDQGSKLRSLSLDKAEALLKNGGHLYDAGGEITMDDINNARAAGSDNIFAQYHNETGLTDIGDVIDSARGGDHYSTITKESALNRIREGQTLLGTDGKKITKEDVQKMSAGSSINISVEGSEARNISAEQAKEIVSRGGHLYDGNREITMEEINSGYVKEFNVNYHDAGDQNATVEVMIDGIADNVNSFKTKVSSAQSSGQDQISTTVNIGGVNIDTEVSTLDASSAIGVFEKRARLDMISGGKNADVNADVKNYIDRIFNDNNETYADVITEIQNFVGYTTDANGQTIVEFKEYTDQKTGKTYSKSDSVDAVKKIIDTQEQKMKKLEQSSQHKQNLSNDEYNKKE